MTLVEFLLARIAEDEAICESLRRGRHFGWQPVSYRTADPNVLCVNPARVLAECQARRRIVEWAAPVLTNWPNASEGARYISEDGRDLLLILAAVYADHPDYREEWKP